MSAPPHNHSTEQLPPLPPPPFFFPALPFSPPARPLPFASTAACLNRSRHVLPAGEVGSCGETRKETETKTGRKGERKIVNGHLGCCYRTLARERILTHVVVLSFSLSLVHLVSFIPLCYGPSQSAGPTIRPWTIVPLARHAG